uniref:dTDP-4-amino-4,6-dideoxygalactose transaminase n=1 Tax=Candidatus Kentrum sp. DK TaxID=2126562 RepID=A0A450T6D0_9GAMM|nr:MAG: dTDP-4-amino-4,6-dideoxygalactose transaminase [Candidatus Kentron sp. DK]
MTSLRPPLYVSRPLLPELSQLNGLMSEIWESRTVTNGGPFHNRLEAELEVFLGVPTVKLFNNATIALLAALKLFELPRDSEIITTPLTFAATAHAIVWNGHKPVFADINPNSLTLDPEAVEAAITPKTSAILGVHVYGNVCDHDGLRDIARRHGLRLIYDAAHAFGVTVDNVPIATLGDASVFSFHATKLFTTLEGGAIATPHASFSDTLYFLRNFGIKNEEEVVAIGINGKMNEVQAAIGLLNLPLVDEERQSRARLRQRYKESLGHLPGLTFQPEYPHVQRSEQYFPLIIDAEVFGASRDDIYAALRARNIHPRKYFHPICTDFQCYRDYPIISTLRKPTAETVKSRLLCLPFFSGVTEEDVGEIAETFEALCAPL